MAETIFKFVATCLLVLAYSKFGVQAGDTECFQKGKTLLGYLIITHENVESAKVCQEEYCVKNIACKSWVFDIVGKKCSLKSKRADFVKLSKDANKIYGTKYCPGSDEFKDLKNLVELVTNELQKVITKVADLESWKAERDITYSEISSTHACAHRNGGDPAGCIKFGGTDSDCKALCTERKLCLGYSYAKTPRKTCVLIVSSQSCLSGENFMTGDFVKSMQDFTVSSSSGFNCHVKSGDPTTTTTTTTTTTAAPAPVDDNNFAVKMCRITCNQIGKYGLCEKGILKCGPNNLDVSKHCPVTCNGGNLGDNNTYALKVCKLTCTQLSGGCGLGIIGCGPNRFDVLKHCPVTCKGV